MVKCVNIQNRYYTHNFRPQNTTYQVTLAIAQNKKRLRTLNRQHFKSKRSIAQQLLLPYLADVTIKLRSLLKSESDYLLLINSLIITLRKRNFDYTRCWTN